MGYRDQRKVNIDIENFRKSFLKACNINRFKDEEEGLEMKEEIASSVEIIIHLPIC